MMASRSLAVSQPRALPSLPSRSGFRHARAVPVRAAYSGGAPVPPDPTPTPLGTPSGPTPVPPVYLRTGAGGGAGTTGGGSSFGGSGGSGGGYNRPVGTGGSGGGSGGRPAGSPFFGWSWDRVLLTLLGIGLAIPAWRYLNRRFFFKPEPEHTLAKAEDKAAEVKSDLKGTGKSGKSAVGKAASAVKHATVEPVVEAVHHGAKAVKHSETGRAIQHKAEDVKDTVDIGVHDTSSKAERGTAHTKKGVKHAVEDTKSKGEDIGAAADRTAHKAEVKGERGVQRAGEKISDAVYDAEVATSKASKGVLEGIKGAATTVGRKLHVVADASEKGTKKAANKAEKATGSKVTTPATSESERRTVAYVTAGIALGTGVLGALYYWDRKGGDLTGKVKKLGNRTREAADTAAQKAREVVGRAQEPAGPTRPTV